MKSIMKKLLYIVVLAAIGIFTSCSDFLTEQLKVEYTSSNFYTTPENATAAVNGIYNSLYGNTLWVFGDVASDDAVKGGNPEEKETGCRGASRCHRNQKPQPRVCSAASHF